MNISLDFLKQTGLITAAGIILGILSISINNLIPWEWLTYLFVIMRHLTPLIDFMVDTTAVFTALGIMFTAQIALWAWKAANLVIDWYKKY